MKTTNIIGFLTIASLPILQSCTDSKGDARIPKNLEPISVRVIEPVKTVGKQIIKASGQLTTDDETVLAFKTSGIVKSILVNEGDLVKKGQLLATLDLREVDGHVAQARHSFEKAQRDYNRVQNLFKDSVATLEQLENSETALAVAKEQLDIAEFNKGFSSIYAPSNGYVLRKFVNPGQVVDVGDPIVMTNGAASGKWILKVGVSDRQWSAIRVGDSADVFIDAFVNDKYNGRVMRKLETSDPTTGAFTIEVEVLKRNKPLASGMFGTATFKSAGTHPTWSIPFQAVLDANDDEGFVFVAHDDNTAVKQRVTIESFDEKEIRISSGLENAEKVIVSGNAYLTDNSPITILK